MSVNETSSYLEKKIYIDGEWCVIKVVDDIKKSITCLSTGNESKTIPFSKINKYTLQGGSKSRKRLSRKRKGKKSYRKKKYSKIKKSRKFRRSIRSRR